MAHSLRILHQSTYVHGDLKPDNILSKNTTGDYTTKLIDFDNSYFAGNHHEYERLSVMWSIIHLSLAGISKGTRIKPEITYEVRYFCPWTGYCQYLAVTCLVLIRKNINPIRSSDDGFH